MSAEWIKASCYVITHSQKGMPSVLQNSALGERVSNFILKERETERSSSQLTSSVPQFSPFSQNHLSYLGNNNLLFQDLHCIICAAGFLPHQNHLPKCAFTQQLQIVKVIHCLSKRRESSEWAVKPPRSTALARARPFVCDDWLTCPSLPRWRFRSERWGYTGFLPLPVWPACLPPSEWPRPTHPWLPGKQKCDQLW